MKQIWRIIVATKTLWRYYVSISVFTVLVAVVNLAMPYLTGKAIDEISLGTSANVRHLVTLAVIIFAADLGYNLLANISGYLGDQVSVKIQRILSINYYRHILDLPQSYYDKEITGKIINRLSRSISQIANFMQMLSNNFLQFVFSTILALIIVAFYSVPVALMLFVLYPIFGYLTVKSSPKWIELQHEKNESLDVASGRFNEAINEIRAVKSYNQERRELSFFSKHINKFVKLNKPQSVYWHAWDTWRRLALNIIFLGIYLYIFLQAAHGHLTSGQAVALILYGMQIRIPLFTISFLVGQTQRAMADSREYFSAMDEPVSLADKGDAKRLRLDRGEVVFKSVSFGYSDSKMIVKDLDFTLKPGTKTALVGESGAGKTTITNLLMRLYDVNQGVISIDSQDISELTQKSLRANIGMVFQEPTLFSGTIRENISYANSKASIEDIESSAIAANAHEFITKFEGGYNTEIGERGLKLSGGQKQRIAIARALLKDAPILILDEATSSLDSKSERAVQKALEELMKNRTTLIIAHRLSTIAGVDQIITLKDGKIDEIGTPVELAKSGGIYDKLLKLQRQHTEDGLKSLEKFEMTTR